MLELSFTWNGDSVNETKSKYDCGDYQHPLRIKFHDHSWVFHQLLKKVAVAERLFWQLGMRFNGHCCCREVLIRVNVWTVHRDKNKIGHCREVAISGGSTVVFSVLLWKFSLYLLMYHYIQKTIHLYTYQCGGGKMVQQHLFVYWKLTKSHHFTNFSSLSGESVQAMIRMSGLF